MHCAGNHKDGALEEGEHTCDFNAQFEERRCRLKLQLDATLCNDSIRLSCVGGNPPLDMVCNQPLPDSLTLWSIGNHFIAGSSLCLCYAVCWPCFFCAQLTFWAFIVSIQGRFDREKRGRAPRPKQRATPLGVDEGAWRLPICSAAP